MLQYIRESTPAWLIPRLRISATILSFLAILSAPILGVVLLTTINAHIYNTCDFYLFFRLTVIVWGFMTMHTAMLVTLDRIVVLTKMIAFLTLTVIGDITREMDDVDVEDVDLRIGVSEMLLMVIVVESIFRAFVFKTHPETMEAIFLTLLIVTGFVECHTTIFQAYGVVMSVIQNDALQTNERRVNWAVLMVVTIIGVMVKNGVHV